MKTNLNYRTKREKRALSLLFVTACCLFATCFFLGSCSQDIVQPDTPTTDGEVTTRDISISVLPMQSVGASTRAAEEMEKGAALSLNYGADALTRAEAVTPVINNAYVLVFNGTGGAATLTDKVELTPAELASGKEVKASITTQGNKCRVYTVANVPEDLIAKLLTEEEVTAAEAGSVLTLADFEAPVNFRVVKVASFTGAIPMVASQDVSIGDTFKTFQLKSLLAKLTFTAKTADGGALIAASVKLKGVPNGYSFKSELPGEKAVRPANMTYATDATLEPGATYYIPENLSGKVDLSTQLVRCAQFAPANAMFVEISLNATTYNAYLGDGSVEDFNVVGNYAYAVSATIYGSNSQLDLRIGNPVISNLSNAGTANCYIVTSNAAAWYSINGTVMGNGASTPVPGNQNAKGVSYPIIPAPLSPVSASVLWETNNMATEATEGSIADATYCANGQILFHCPGTKQGNAVIAAKDAKGDIIWSWHIWRINAQPAAITLANLTSTSGNFDATGNTTLSGLQMMDRNLGALSATAQDSLSTGLMYQWGRKDPFPGSNLTTAIVTVPSGIPAMATGGASVTPAMAVKNPTTFYTNAGDWTSRNDNLWGTPLTGTVTVGSPTFNSNAGSKSIYDPCPAGWRVVPGYAFANAAKTTFNKGFSFETGFAVSGSVWFPATGDRYLNNVGTFGYYWTSAPTTDGGGGASRMHLQQYGVNTASSDFRSAALSCRCIKE